MLRSLRTAERAMQLQQVRIETLANNLANVDSTGFKQILTQVSQLRGRPAGEASADAAQDKRGAIPLRRTVWETVPQTRIRAVMDTRPGPLMPTGKATDMAIIGEGFFVVSNDEGEFYTRDGSFHLDGKQRLVNAAGHPVQGTGGELALAGTSFSVGQDGSVVVDGEVAGRIKIVKFDNPTLLIRAGSSYFRAPPDLQAEEVPGDKVHIVQGQVEGGNVDPIRTLIDMISAQRAFEFEAKIMQANDETLDRSVNQLGRKA